MHGVPTTIKKEAKVKVSVFITQTRLSFFAKVHFFNSKKFDSGVLESILSPFHEQLLHQRSISPTFYAHIFVQRTQKCKKSLLIRLSFCFLNL
jgi:hypothetical protein